MAKWRLKRGMPEWHAVMLFEDTLRDGTVITASTEDCDGDVEYWSVREDGVLVACGACWSEPYGTAQALASRVICFGATDEQRATAAKIGEADLPQPPATIGDGALPL